MGLIKMPSELSSDAPISCLVYGQPGVGKTSLAISSEKPLLIDLDRGLIRVAKKNQCPSVQVENYSEVLEVLSSDEISEFKTIVIDTFGKLIDKIGDWCCEQNPKYRRADGGFSMQGWGAIKMQAQLLLKQLASKGKNVIFVAHEKEDKDGDERILRPDISGSAGKDLIKDLDLMGYMQMRNNRRTICFNPTDKFYAKNSVGLTGFLEVPDNAQSNTFFRDKIAKAISEQRASDNELRNRYDELVSNQCASIEHIETVEDLNVAYSALKDMEVIWDSSIQWKVKLNEKAKALKAVYNKDSGVFDVSTDNA